MRWLPFVVLVGCADPNLDLPTGGDIAWEACSLFHEGKERPRAQCATVDVPLDWADPDGPTIELFVQRHLSDTSEPDQQLWMLAGGPGQPGAVFDGYVKSLAKEAPNVDFYLTDHRGVGRSSRLGCPDQEADESDDGFDVTAEEWPDCLAAVEAEWGEGLQQFTTSNAARDLAHLIALADDPAQEVFVYGGSYGTTLGHRFLQIFPTAVDGMILDSVAIDVDHASYDADFDEVGRQFLVLCAADELCGERLPDPFAITEDLIARLDEGHCPDAGIDAATLRAGIGSFLPDFGLRTFAPALIYRLDRCDEDDVEAIRHLVDLFAAIDDVTYYDRLGSDVLFTNIELSEQWPDPPPSIEAVDAAYEATLFSFAIGPTQRRLWDDWPRYPRDEHWNGLAETDIPLLFLQGGLDPQTPVWRTDEAARSFDGPGQHYVTIPTGGHILLGGTPMTGGGDCGTELLLGFLDDPMATPDTSCIDWVKPIVFQGQALSSKLLLGNTNRWGEGCGCASGARGGGLGLVAFGLVAIAARRRRRTSGSDRDR